MVQRVVRSLSVARARANVLSLSQSDAAPAGPWWTPRSFRPAQVGTDPVQGEPQQAKC
jgi:hypothetical protein